MVQRYSCILSGFIHVTILSVYKQKAPTSWLSQQLYSLHERGQKCGCAMSERNLPEVMCAARAGRQRNVNHAHWNVALEDTIRTQTRSRVWKSVFTADLGVNAFLHLSIATYFLILPLAGNKARCSQHLEWEDHSEWVNSFLMERIFRSTPNGVLMAHSEWLPGVRLRHSVPPVQDI